MEYKVILKALKRLQTETDKVYVTRREDGFQVDFGDISFIFDKEGKLIDIYY